jgi:hypothetical protein
MSKGESKRIANLVDCASEGGILVPKFNLHVCLDDVSVLLFLPHVVLLSTKYFTGHALPIHEAKSFSLGIQRSAICG